MSAKRIKEKSILESDEHTKTQLSEKVGQLESKMESLALDRLTKSYKFPEDRLTVMTKIDEIKALVTEKRVIETDILKINRELSDVAKRENELQTTKSRLLSDISES